MGSVLGPPHPWLPYHLCVTFLFFQVPVCCSWMPGTILHCSSTLFIEAGSLNYLRSSQIWLVLQASLFWGILSLPSYAGITGSPLSPTSIYKGFRDPKPQSSHLGNMQLSYWPISRHISSVLSLSELQIISVILRIWIQVFLVSYVTEKGKAGEVDMFGQHRVFVIGVGT